MILEHVLGLKKVRGKNKVSENVTRPQKVDGKFRKLGGVWKVGETFT